jgi:hypothetical protein
MIRPTVLLWLLLASACGRPVAQQPYDVLITGGSVLNGEGTPAVRHERNKPFQGKRMSDLIATRGGHQADVLFDVLLEEGGSAPTVFFIIPSRTCS